MVVKAVLLLLSTISMTMAVPQVVLTFRDSIVVDKSKFTLGDIASVECADNTLLQNLLETEAGVSAPPSFGRYLAVKDFVTFQLKNKFTAVSFICKGAPRPLVRTGYQILTVKSCAERIAAKLDAVVEWPAGSWQYSIKNSNDSLRIMNHQAVAIEVCGFSQPFFPKGNINLSIRVTQPDREFRIPVMCVFTVNCAVVVALRDITRGETLDIADCLIKTVDITHFTPDPKTEIGAVAGKRAARSIKKGTVFHDRILAAVPAVEKGELVSIIHSGRGLSIAVSGTAREAGCAGDRIWVENSATNKLLRVKILEKGKVAITSEGNRS